MQFQQLLESISDRIVSHPGTDAEISAPVVEDSRTVKRGGVFVARKGPNTDSHDLIGDAVRHGAAAVIGERPPDQLACSVPYAQVDDAQQAIGWLAAAYYDYPSRQLVVVGVTGTDGKTTTTNLIFSILKAAGVRVGMISTVSAVIGDEELPTGLHVTTPSAPEVQMYLRRMVESGLTHCVLETTSHGLAQGRVNGVEYDVAVLTNVTHEHLDFHGSFENYRDAKALLFKKLSQSSRKPNRPKVAVVNLDDPSAPTFLAAQADYRIRYGLNTGSRPDLTADATYSAAGTALTIRFQGDPKGAPQSAAKLADVPLQIHTGMVGPFNVQIVLAATGAALGLD